MVLWSAYSLKNLWARRVTTGLTMVGMGLVVFVFMAVMMLAQGLERAMGKTGDPDNAIVLRKGALSDLESAITRDQAAIIPVQPEVLLTAEGRSVAVREVGLQITLRKAQSGILTSLSLRGSAPEVFAVRPRVRLVEGRPWEPGTTSSARRSPNNFPRPAFIRSCVLETVSGRSSASLTERTAASTLKCGEMRSNSWRPFIARSSPRSRFVLRIRTSCPNLKTGSSETHATT